MSEYLGQTDRWFPVQKRQTGRARTLPNTAGTQYFVVGAFEGACQDAASPTSTHTDDGCGQQRLWRRAPHGAA